MPPAARVLVVDNDPQMLRYVRDTLTAAGYAAVVTGDHAQLSRTIRSERPHLVLLDLVLPGADGIALLGSVPELADLPVVFISGYGRDDTLAQALKAGAADYLVKPFSPTELTARVEAALRRVARPEPFALGELAIHYEERRVTVAGCEVELTATEYELLRVLSLNAGRVVAYDALLHQVWSGRKARGNVNLARNFVKKLRAKPATTRRAWPGYSACAGSATACRIPTTPDGSSRRGRYASVAQALEAGAADYIVKPFSPTELAARVGAAPPVPDPSSWASLPSTTTGAASRSPAGTRRSPPPSTSCSAPSSSAPDGPSPTTSCSSGSGPAAR